MKDMNIASAFLITNNKETDGSGTPCLPFTTDMERLLAERDQIARGTAPDKRLTRVFNVIDKSTIQDGTGAVLCMADKFNAFDSNNLIVPIWMI